MSERSLKRTNQEKVKDRIVERNTLLHMKGKGIEAETESKISYMSYSDLYI